MFPPIIGLMILLASLGLVVVGLSIAVGSLFSHRPGGMRLGLILAGGTVAGYALVWVVGLVTAESRVLGVGQEAHFCGVDCHLHVSVVKATRDTDVEVTLRFRSDAKQAAEFPYLLTYKVVDEAGHRYAPSFGAVGEPLKAGEMVEHEMRFSLPPEAKHPRLEVYYESLMDYLVPGQANPLAQRRTRLDLGSS